jgi:hypothetical protein
MLVEDNPVDIDLTRRAFNRNRLSNPLIIATDGEEALDWISQWDRGENIPVIILLDLKLPKIDGLEVLRIIKGHPRYRTIPIVVLTTSHENSDIKQAYLYGANSYIVKPVDFEKFVEVAGQIELYWRVLNEPANPTS